MAIRNIVKEGDHAASQINYHTLLEPLFHDLTLKIQIFCLHSPSQLIYH